MKKRRQKKAPEQHPFWENANIFLHHRRTILLTISVVVYLIFSFFTFNLRISEGGDDSTYIIRALSLIEAGNFPEYQGPLYPLVLSVFIAVFGAKVELLKLTSWLFLSLALVLFYKSFRNRISLI